MLAWIFWIIVSTLSLFAAMVGTFMAAVAKNPFGIAILIVSLALALYAGMQAQTIKRENNMF